jgi:hypothetical protein
MITYSDTAQIISILGEHCNKDAETGCWVWQRSYRGNGYAQLTLSGRRQVAGHRAAWSAYRGAIPQGMYVCHRCDNPACCNPDHLFLGTAKENTRDCMSKGRLRPGKAGGARKLSGEQIAMIPALRAIGMLQREIGAALGVSQVRVSQVLRSMN